MMGQLGTPLLPPARRSLFGAGRLLAALSAGLVLTGCTPRWHLPTVLYMAVGVASDQAIDSALFTDFNAKLDILESGFQRLYPGTSFQISLYPEDKLVEEMGRRNRQGLGPDILLVLSLIHI